jgi:endoglucanase
MKTRTWLAWALCAWGIGAAGAAGAACINDNGGGLTGVNLAGAEFNSKRLPGVMNKDYVYPTKEELAYLALKGATAVRLPFRWERAQRELMGGLDEAEIAAIATVVETAAKLGLCVILDAHNYAAYGGQPVGSESVPEEAFVDLWTRLARRFPDDSRVAFGLMNEPKNLPIAQWAGLAQRTVQALRDAGAQNLILVSGGRYSGVHEWSKEFSGTSNAKAFAGLTDPLGRTAIEVHQYADANFSGTGTECLPPERFDNMFRVIAEWARASGHKLFLGEFGVPGTATCLATLERFLTLTADREAWLGWAYWAGGRWWGTYPLSIAPRGGVDAPQMSVVSRYLGQ